MALFEISILYQQKIPKYNTAAGGTILPELKIPTKNEREEDRPQEAQRIVARGDEGALAYVS